MLVGLSVIWAQPGSRAPNHMVAPSARGIDSMSTSQESILDSGEIVRGYLNDVQEGDPGAVDRYFAEDVTYITITTHTDELKPIMPWFGVHNGRDGVKELNALLLANLEVVEFELTLAFGFEEHAAAFGRWCYRSKTTSKVVESDWAVRATVRDGLITYYHFFESDYTLGTAFRKSGSWQIENHLGSRQVP
jgi:ketosteroid isomerase-like protein